MSASQARQLATALLTAAMDQRAEIGFRSYDRLFPSQDSMPHGGFGNMIALPLQRAAREHGHSVFIDDVQNPYPDQWAYLASIQKVEAPTLESLLRGLISSQHGATRVCLPTNEEESTTPRALTAAANPTSPVTEPLPKRVVITLADQIYIDRTALPASMVTRQMRLAVFQNPEFYQAQAMRFPTFDMPRVISCAALHPHHLELPRGCLDDARDLLASNGVEIDLSDERQAGDLIGVRFIGTLRPDQQKAADLLLAHDCGVLAATTAFGKTVLAIALIAARGRNARILVHRQQLLDQWVEQLRAFLDVSPDAIGTMGGGKKRLTGKVDVALIQSLLHKHEVDDRVTTYGRVVIDECLLPRARSSKKCCRYSRSRNHFSPECLMGVRVRYSSAAAGSRSS